MAASQSNRLLRAYPEPFIVQPTSGVHRQTFILLHGRGSNGADFAADLLHTRVPGFGSDTTLSSIFPHAMFVFPTAARRRAQVFNRSLANQWFDLWDLKKETEREELQFEGLRESSEYVQRLLNDANRNVGSANVVLWGLSQGCAISLISLMLWDAEPPAACVGMCGWLPLRRRMTETRETDTIAEHNPFDHSEDGPFERSEALDLASCLRELLDVPSSSGEGALVHTPTLLSHGTQDEKVDIRLGREASSFLNDIGGDVLFRKYEGLGHWFSGEMLRDVVKFLHARAGLLADHAGLPL